MNVVVISGRIAAPPELREFESGSRLVRYLVTTRSEHPQPRVDVLPVTIWDPPQALVTELGIPGQPIWLVGAVQRRFWAAGEGRRSRLELVAHQVELQEAESDIDKDP